MSRHRRPERGTAVGSSPSSNKEENFAWIFWEHYLKRAGWKQFVPNQHAESFGFLPVQYLKDFYKEADKMGDANGASEKTKNKPNARDFAHFLMKHGKRREHYAIGWDDLYFMIQTYGEIDKEDPTFLLDYNGPPLFGQKSTMNKESNARVVENLSVDESNTPEIAPVPEKRSNESVTDVAPSKQKKKPLAHNLFSPKYEVGTKVRKEFGHYGWFDGKIVSISWKHQTYNVVYDDGDIEDYYFELPEIDEIVQHAQQKQKGDEERERETTALDDKDDDDDECSLDDEALQAQVNAEIMAGVMEGCLFREKFQQLDAMEANILESTVTPSAHSNNNDFIPVACDAASASDTSTLKRKECINSESTRGQPRRKVIRPKSQILDVNETNNLETKQMMMNKIFDDVPIKELSIVFKSVNKSNDEKKCHVQQEESKKLEKDEVQPTPPCPTPNYTQPNFQPPVPYYQGHPPPPPPMYHFYQSQYYYGPCPQPPPPFYYPCGSQYYCQPPPPPPRGYAPNAPDSRFHQ